ncbi:hypothetical protein CcaverHIS002_0212910 [Cutaneotrichosporon cavernicola]|uniref:Uncharacterized protein n=1 Tax=Cutaneotrichosporon cavernicola TaxID=279322 RepID=A0AA48KYZ8_9TREE|nr:uncharacterized protein CcaverHIS019_0212910 [Cutaneotrichosporon cavernicola]BEI82131.1 hypothetical protein CcaverHIS002_0212910 [Cutaneotrichosporon cavernicola]BEI89929.1 hypothetical protein CcaverHIS019_0212910 [Cutaneotrichosporon cavernicola]BEI97700.1 hypothetical protein CcaverHIS631_0212890 [Cutaneotrichosporon cavernicola]BEJ05477.1 hypothetical protein CcaverHIS641_0212940 [Cutaneotrichosporon cavernicola]
MTTHDSYLLHATPASSTSAPGISPPRTPYVPVLDPTFPRATYGHLDSYADPDVNPSARILWAARDASRVWPRVASGNTWATLDETTVLLTVFDKAHALNQAQWSLRPRRSPHEWRVETNGYIDLALVYARRALHAADALDRSPTRARARRFCRDALDACAELLVDGRPLQPDLLREYIADHNFKPSIDDRIGVLLGEYDPLIRHAAVLARPPVSSAAPFTHDPVRGEYVLDEVPELGSDDSDTSAERVAVPQMGDMRDDNVDIVSEGRPSIDADRHPPVTRKT